MKIDFVITWVDGNDPNWRKQKREYSPVKASDDSDKRYRDMGILKYWFRAVEKYAPWVNKVHFITWGHLPEWLNVDCPKLNIVRHEDYIPKQYLPTFSSHPIELNIHRIEGLEEHFVYFNDDMILNNEVFPDFFFKKGLPCDFLNIEDIYFSDIDDAYSHITVNNTWTLNNHYSYIKSFFKHPTKYISFKYPAKHIIKNILKLEHCNTIPGFCEHHMAEPYCKKSLERAWERHGEVLDNTCKNKFRTPFDVSQTIFRGTSLFEGEFYPVSPKSRGRYIQLKTDIKELKEAILNSEYKMLCINDSSDDIDFEKVKQELIDIYEKKLPEKSEFEL